jgi:hypothetical protein
MPFGKTAGQVNPSVNPTRFNYPRGSSRSR